MAEMVKLTLPAEVKALAQFEPLLDVPGVLDRLLDKLQRDPPDVIYMALDADRAVEFVGKLHQRAIKSLLMGGQQMLSQVFWRAAGSAAEGIQVLAPLETSSPQELGNTIDLFKKAGVVPDLVALYSYVAVQVWAGAVRIAGNGDPKKVAEALRNHEFTTSIGRVAFDRNGDRRDIKYSIATGQGGPLTELRVLQQQTGVAPVSAAPRVGAAPDATEPSVASHENILRFEDPLPFGPFPVIGNSIEQLADSVPLFSPIEGQNDAVWKKSCSNCHKWDRQTLCQQGASYVASPQNVLRLQHPFGGPLKVALMRWSKGGCQ
jgi:hypothetical protein